MIFGGQSVSSGLKKIRAVSKRYQDPGLSALLAAQLILAFVGEPLAFEGFEFPLIAIGIIVAGLILLLALGSNQHGALIVVGAAGAVRLLTLGADLVWGAPMAEVADATSAVLALLAVMWVVFEIVFGPGRITAHRVRGAIVLYLSIAIVFAWAYRLVAEVAPDGFSGLEFAAGQHGALSPFLYYSLTSLTTLGLGDITPVDAFARSLTALEALLGQLFPAVILARILTLYMDEKHREAARSEEPPIRATGA
jgi:ion channel